MSSVIFNEEKHIYTLVDDNGKPIHDLVSVTTLLKKHGLSPDYSMIDEEVLKAKAQRGTIIHEELENYINNGEEMGFTNELLLFINKCKELDIKPLKSEFIVHNDEIAGTVDVSGTIGVDPVVSFIGDFKTTATLHRESVAWQLSIYAYLTQQVYNKFLVFHFPDEKTLKIVELKPIAIEEVEELLRCERDCEIYQRKTFELSVVDTEKLLQVQSALKTLDEQKKILEKQEEQIKELLISKFEETGLEYIENDYFRIKYTPPTTRETIDSKRLKAEQPEIAKEFTTVSSVKAKVTITIRGN